jgi:hypothetical protein
MLGETSGSAENMWRPQTHPAPNRAKARARRAQVVVPPPLLRLVQVQARDQVLRAVADKRREERKHTHAREQSWSMNRSRRNLPRTSRRPSRRRCRPRRREARRRRQSPRRRRRWGTAGRRRRLAGLDAATPPTLGLAAEGGRETALRQWRQGKGLSSEPPAGGDGSLFRLSAASDGVVC